MKAITVQPPWSWAIAHGGKNIENRTANWTYRGQIAIHAGLRWSERGAEDPRIRHALGWMGGTNEADDAYHVRGAVVALAELVDCHPDGGCCEPWGERSYVEHGGRLRTAVYHLALADVRTLPEPVPCRGQLGLWNVPDEVAVQVTQQLATGATP